MNHDIEIIFDLYQVGITKSYDEILEDNKYCGVMRERLQYLCLERGYSFKWLNDNFGLAYNICGLLYLSFFREFLFIGTCTLYKSLEKYCLAKFGPSDDDIIILRSLVFLILSKNMESLKGVEETVDYVLDCIRNQDAIFARKVLSISMKDNQKYRFNFGIVTGDLNGWERFVFDRLFHSCILFEKEYLDRIYKHVVCLWPLEERWKVAYAIDEYFTYSSEFWGQHEGTKWEDDLKVNITKGMKYLKNLVEEDMHRDNETMALKGTVNDEMERFEVINKGANVTHNNQGNIKVRSKGRKPESLFKNKKGEKDDALTLEWATLFVKYLKLHKVSSMVVYARKDNYVNKAFVVFYRKWEKAGNALLHPNGNACYRFLQEDCKLQIKPEKKTYANCIRSMINETDKCSLLDIEVDVDDFLELHNK